MSRESAVTIAPAAPAGLDAIFILLRASGLPLEGVSEHLDDFFTASDEGGQVVGCAGLERYEQFGLLRSVAVSETLRQSGTGSRLTARLLAHAKETGIKEIVLLTTTAQDFFAKHFGFEEAGRADYDAQFAASKEWNLPRCSTAAVMRLRL